MVAVGGTAFAVRAIDDDAPPASPPVNHTSDASPDVLRVTCTSEGVKLDSTRVAARPDGVHVIIENPHDLNGAWFGELPGDKGRYTFNIPLGRDSTKITLPIPPGPVYVNCFPGHWFDARSIARDDLVEMQVVDDAGFWHTDQLACTDPLDAEGLRAGLGRLDELEGSAEGAVRKHVPGILPTDELLEAGYPEPSHRDQPPWIVVSRDGKQLAIFSVPSLDEGYWVRWGNTCPGSGIAGG